MTTHTNIVCVIDESGSMQSLKQQTIDGFNRFIEDQKKEPGYATLTLVKFSNGWRMPIKAVELKEIPPLQEIGYEPDGGTALLDALGVAIKTTGELLEASAKVIFVIITDGQENASTDYKLEQVKEMIQAREAKGWDFIYLGANQDAFTASAAMGMAGTYTANTVASASATAASYGYVSETVAASRTATSSGARLSTADALAIKRKWQSKLEDKEDSSDDDKPSA